MSMRRETRVEIRTLEERLANPGPGESKESLAEVFATQFREFGSSGRIFDAETVLGALGTVAQRPSRAPISLDGFRVERVAPNVVLATYLARLPAGPGWKPPTLRSSLWCKRGAGWQILFHQGTPTPSDGLVPRPAGRAGESAEPAVEGRVTDYAGRCHCGAVTVTFRTAKDPRQWALRRCGCSFCVRFGGIYTSDPAGEIVLRSEVRLRRYQFGQRTADFLFCPTCGVYFGAATDIDGKKLAVLNVRVLDGVALDLASAQPMDFDAESVELRTSRRVRNWTPLAAIEPEPQPP